MTASTLRVLVVDDEPLARERIVGLLDEQKDVEVVAECATGRQAIDAIRAHAPDVVFLDVQMPGLTGLDVAQALDPAEMPAIVFVTAYDEHAVRAFELHALDYLLKPFADRRFDEALRRARARIESQRLLEEFSDRVSALLTGRAPVAAPATRADRDGTRPADQGLERLVVRDGERSILLPVEEIDWIEAANYYVVVHAATRTYVIRDTLAALERELDPRFVRVHRSTIVNLDRVVEFQRLFHGDFAVLLADGTDLKLSRTYRGAVEARLGRPI